MPNSITFGKKLKALRINQGLTQEEMASKLGISRRAYIPYEQDKTRPRNKETYRKIADILNYDVDEMEELLENNKENTMPTRECRYDNKVECTFQQGVPNEVDCVKCITKNAKGDMVAHPAHYVEGRKYEPKDVIRDWQLNYNLGCVVKYISRAGRKNDILEDLQKARQYLTFEIEALEEEQTHGT